MKKIKKSVDKKEEVNNKSSINLIETRTLFVYDDTEDLDFFKSSNEPHINVEDGKNWQGYKMDDNPNLIGQIRNVNGEVIFHLCFCPANKFLTKEDIQAILKCMEHIEEFNLKKHNLTVKNKLGKENEKRRKR